MDAKSGHHFVEDQYRAVTIAQRTKTLEKTRRRHHQIHVAGDWLDDHAGDVVSVRRECRIERREIVVGHHDRFVRDRARHTRRGGLAERQRARPGLDEKAIPMAVIAAFELHDLRACRVASREA